ncbi:DUF5979 domain-containing protein [Aeromicrobium duanguangcaii]|uniref:DUF5979 domain-containing protein n=1 Tax=Aeromicrobium duanguangcaii TaxID=2968086 RepID=UPI0020174B91|nr:DUF5979 domain-containing protein [Aeromicrobium duanguangcaii]MCL3838227.1 DUF5979 domain-containing protein [Aeromicrobium duanguangcaii]
MRRALSLLSALLLVLLTFAVGTSSALAAEATADLQIMKSVDSAGPHGPGDTFSYTIVVGCSSTNDLGCVDAALNDALPDPLVLDPAVQNPVAVSLSPAGPADVKITGDDVTVRPQHQLGSDVGLRAGGSMTVTIAVQVPPTVSADLNGATLTNVASVVADNADRQSSSADVTVRVTTTLAADVTKSVSPATVGATAGRPVTWTLKPGNASNQTVDTIVVEDVFDGAGQDHLDFVSVDSTRRPATTTSTKVEYLVEGAWTTAAPGDPSDVDGVRVTYAGSFAPGVSGEVRIAQRTNSRVAAIADQQSVRVENSVTTTVAKGGTVSAEADDDASLSILKRDPDVKITKSFSDTTLVIGQEVTAALHAAVGAQDVHTLVIHEPSAGRPSFSDQGLAFTGFGDDLEWPVTAVSASIDYRYSDCATSTARTTRTDTLPGPTAGCTVEGFTLTFTAADGTDGIESSAYAEVPVEFTALTDITAATTSTNHVDTQVSTVDGATGRDDDAATFTIRPLEVFTAVDKTISPSQIWALPGARATVGLSARVRADSTAGSDRLVISDPVDPARSPSFFSSFDVTAIENTDIPACAQLTVRYWSKGDEAWVVLPGAENVAGEVAKWGIAIPASVRADLGGIQLDFAPRAVNGCPQVLPPGFNVMADYAVALKSGVPNAAATIDNDVQSRVHNATIDKGHTDTAADDVILEPTSGTGPDLVDKTWLENTVPALSGATRTARIGWSTQGLNFASMTITDPATTAELGPGAPGIATSVYDAFDLRSIGPVTPVIDPLIVNDRVAKVELFRSGTWVDVTAQACSSELACRGTFPGLTLTTAQQADTTGARITFTELVAGAGVGSSYARRPLDLSFQVRDTLRSTGDYVLGTRHAYTYNTADAGVVNNTVSVRGFGGVSGDRETRDSDRITIVDSPVNVSLTKAFDQTQLGLPIRGTVDADDYPLITSTLTARNTSAVRISSMVVADPSPDQVAPTAFDVLDLHQIATIPLPSGIVAADVTVTLDHDGTPRDYTRAQALALSPADLADVVGVTVAYARADGRPVIAANASAAIDLVFQLRQDKRSGDPVATTSPGGVPILNEARVQADSPGRVPCLTVTTPGCSAGTATADDEFNIVGADYRITGSKTIAPASVHEDESTTYTTTLVGQPLGSARTTVMTLTDDASTFWNVMDYASASIRLPAPVNQARMDVKIGTTWTSGDWVSSAAGSTVNFALPGGTSAGSVVGVRFAFRQIVNGAPVQWERAHNPRLPITLVTTRRQTQRGNGDPVSTTRPGMDPNEGETQQGVISNTFVVDAQAQFGAHQSFTATQSYSASTLVRHRANAIKVEKAPGNTTRPPTYAPSGTIPYVLTITNTGDWDMTGFTVVDQFDLVGGASPVKAPTPAAYTFSLTSSNAAKPVPSPAPAFSAAYDEATGRLSVTAPSGFVFKSGWKLTVNAPMEFADGLGADTVVANSVTASSDRDFERCDYTVDRSDRPRVFGVADCTATTHVQPLAAATLSMRKGVKGDEAGAPGTGADDLGVVDLLNRDPSECAAPDADGFHHGSCVPVTRPGGEETWRLEMLNTGNTNAKTVAVVDTLPQVGDRGVITSAGRGSQFDVTLRNGFDSTIASLRHDGGVLKAYYSTARLSTACNTNAIQVHTNNASADGSCAFGWTEYTPSTPNSALAKAQSVKFVIDWSATAGAGLRPDETVAITFNTRTPTQLPAAVATGTSLPIAYNSFAGTSRTVATQTQAERGEIVLEPTRVGVATATGRVTIDKTVDAPTFSVPVDLPSSYTFDVACSSDGDPVRLADSTGKAFAGPVRVSVDAYGDGSTVLNSAGSPLSVPLFAECVVVESPVPAGATVTVDPADGTVVADRSLAGVTGIQNPHVGAANGPVVAVTNTYTTGGFEITKAVDNGGAVNQDGDPVVYDRDYAFDVTCEYLGREILAEQVTLADGATKRYASIPGGAECSVEETDARGGTVSVEVDGAAAANPATFTVVEGTRVEVDVTNTFAVGSVRIEKDFTGPGAAAWGLEPVQLRLVCELGGVEETTVFDDTHTLRAPDDLEWEIDDLPVGAECVVSEPKNGGANRVSIQDEEFEVQAGSQAVLVAAENFFDEGSVKVTKTLSGDGAAFRAVQDGTWTMSLECTREVDGVVQTIAVPGGADRVITGAGEATWDGLPTGATCVVDETASSPVPQQVTITPQNGEVVVPGGGASGTPVAVTVDNRFDAGFLTVNKLIDGPGEALHGGDSYEFEVECTLAGAPVLTDRVTIERDGDATSLWSDPIGPMPTGASCHVVETEAGAADRSTGAATVVIGAGTTAEAVVATITNTYGAGEVEVTKKVEGRFADRPEVVRAAFAMTLTCQIETTGPTGATVLGTVHAADFSVRAGRTATFAGADGEPLLLPTGTRCFVEETDAGGATEVEVSHPDFASGATVTSVDTTARIGIDVTNVFDENVWDVSNAGCPDCGTSGSGGDLADSGSGVTAGWAALGVLSLLTGGSAVALARRRSRAA